MNYKLKVYTIFEVGQRKDAQGNPHQEDCIYPAQGMEKDSDRLFILCDGMGGHDAGEVASATVCDAMSRSILSHPDADTNFTDQMLQQAIDAAFDALDRKDTGAVKKMGTTMTFLKLHSHGATIAHMGDSRVYHIRQGRTAAETQILFRTQDHSLVNDLVRAGEMTEEQARHSKQKNIITRAMQPHMDRRPKAEIYHAIDVCPGDYFYMCSDGMLEQMSDDQLREIFSWNYDHGDDNRKVATLRDLTRNNRDNHSAIIVHILQPEYRSYGATAQKKSGKLENNIIAGAVVIGAAVAVLTAGVATCSGIFHKKDNTEKVDKQKGDVNGNTGDTVNVTKPYNPGEASKIDDSVKRRSDLLKQLNEQYRKDADSVMNFYSERLEDLDNKIDDLYEKGEGQETLIEKMDQDMKNLLTERTKAMKALSKKYSHLRDSVLKQQRHEQQH